MAPPGHRAVAFSTKAKKKQLQNKREQKRQQVESTEDGSETRIGKAKNFLPFMSGAQSDVVQTESVNQQPIRGRQANRFNLKFQADTKEDIEARKAQARLPLQSKPATTLEIGCDTFFVPGLEFPKRPTWDYNLSPEVLDAKENRYFREYVDNIHKEFKLSELSYFEMNLETWRQLWRVLEMSDILLVIVDARFPSLLFPPSLHDYATKVLKKHVILVINKADLVPAPVLAAWKHYFEKKFPGTKVILTSSLRPQAGKGKFKGKKFTNNPTPITTQASLSILEACNEFSQGKVDLSSWKMKILEEARLEDVDFFLRKGDSSDRTSNASDYGNDSGILTIGCIGQPNVGKSSLINALMGKKVVSVSKTPGHTKHFQTIFITPNVKLCDCPGLIFPSKCPRTWQVLTGSYPVAHLREPYTAVQFLAQHLNLPLSLKLKHPQEEEGDRGESEEWSAYDICEAWAIKRGFMTKRAARPDDARAANNLLRLALEGRICVYLFPPNYHSEASAWESSEAAREIMELQSRGQPETDNWSETSSEVDVNSENEEHPDGGTSDSESSESDSAPKGVSQNKFALLTDE